LYTLYIDTHFRDIVFVLYKDNVMIKMTEKKNCDQTSKYTINLLDNLFSDAKINIKEITKIIVCNGPGS